MSKRKLVLLLITLLILGSFGAYFFVKQRSGADIVEAGTGTLSGTVTEVETGLPIAGAKLELRLPVSITGRARYEPIKLVSDERGELVKDSLKPADGYDLKLVSLPNRKIQSKSTQINIRANQETIIEIKADKNGQINFNVSEPSPASGVKVSGKLYTRDGEPIGNREIRIGRAFLTKTNNNGVFEINQVPRGIYPIKIINNNPFEIYKIDYYNEIPLIYVSGKTASQKVAIYGWRKERINNQVYDRSRSIEKQDDLKFNFVDFDNNNLSNVEVVCTINDNNSNRYKSDEKGYISIPREELDQCQEISFSWANLEGAIERYLVIEKREVGNIYDFIEKNFRLRGLSNMFRIPVPRNSLIIVNIDIRNTISTDIIGEIDRDLIKLKLDDNLELPKTRWLVVDGIDDINMKIFVDISSKKHKLSISAPGYNTAEKNIETVPLKPQIVNLILEQTLDCIDTSIGVKICYSNRADFPSSFHPNLINAIDFIRNLTVQTYPDTIYVLIGDQEGGTINIDRGGSSIVLLYTSTDKTPEWFDEKMLNSVIIHEFGHLFDFFQYANLSGTDPSVNIVDSTTDFLSSNNENFQNKFYKAIFNVADEEEFNDSDSFPPDARIEEDHFLKKIVDRAVQTKKFGYGFGGHPWDNNVELFATDFFDYFFLHDTFVDIIKEFGSNTKNYNLGVFDYKFIRYMVDLVSDNDYDFPIANSKENQDPFPCGNIFEGGKVWTAEQILNGDFLKCEEKKSSTATLQGKVYDRNGHWIAGAKVEVLDKKNATAVTVKDPRQANYPEEGVNYIIPDIPLKEAGKEEDVRVRASADGCPNSELSVTLKPYDKTKREIITVQNFQLLCNKPPETTKPSTNQISGTITNSTTNQPLANAEITIDFPAPIPDLHAVTDAFGNYTVIVPDTVQNATNITVTANHSSSSAPRDRIITYGGSSIQTDFQLVPKATRASENTPPNITKLTYQKTTSKKKTILIFNYQAEDKEDKSTKIKYSYRLNNGQWSKWTKKTKVKYNITKYQGQTVSFELRVRDDKKKEGRGQRVEMRRQ